MEAAYEGLDDATQRHLSSLTAIHDWGFPRQAMLSAGTPQTRIDELVAKFPPVEHPVIRTHPVSRRKLVYVNPIYTVGIKGMSESEGRALLERLFRLPYTAEYQVRFRWTRNAVAFWDNRSTQHYVVNDFARYHRRMSRVTVAGDRPF